MSLGRVTLETLALEALIAGDRDLAVELIEQLTPTEAETVVTAAASLASLAADVVADGCRSKLGHRHPHPARRLPARERHLRVVK
jgi:hypothetical protein